MPFFRYLAKRRLSFYDAIWIGPSTYALTAHHWGVGGGIFLFGVISSVILENLTQA